MILLAPVFIRRPFALSLSLNVAGITPSPTTAWVTVCARPLTPKPPPAPSPSTLVRFKGYTEDIIALRRCEKNDRI
jgi:hypothetical protein